MIEIKLKEYPYEMFCRTCGYVPAYLDHLPEDGEGIKSKHARMLDGNPPVPGSEIVCLCPVGTPKAFDARKRRDDGRPHMVTGCGECGSTTNPIDHQCLNCGCAVCVRCPHHDEKC